VAEQLIPLSQLWLPPAKLVLAALIVMGSPGPSTMSATAVGAAFGFRRSLRYLSGLVLGTVAVLLAVATGIVAMLLSMPRIAPVLSAIAAVYILYLAFRIATAPPLSMHGRDPAAPSFAGGFLLAAANPKAYVAIAAVFAGTSLTGEAGALDAGLKVVVLGLMIVVIHLGWLLAGAALSGILRDPVRSRIANLAFAVILVATTALAFLP
jgi:threonine/homoserine/homoserine lactone efflux protein